MENYVIHKHIGNLSKANNGWIKELNFISWSNREPVYDIRTWNIDHTQYGRGVKITVKEMSALQELLNRLE